MDARRLYEGGYFYESKQVGATRSAWCTCLAACFWLCQHRDCRPWSATVRITRVAGDVAGCTAVGNVKAHLGTDEGPTVGDEVKFRNQVIGFGGNVGFVTLDGAYTSPAEGVAYRCPASL
jgi:hypothetical protein